MFSCEYCEIFINNYYENHLQTAAFKGVLKRNSHINAKGRVKEAEYHCKNTSFLKESLNFVWGYFLNIFLSGGWNVLTLF